MIVTALRPRAEVELDKFGLDPSCKLYLPLWKLDGASFMSGDAYGHLCTNHGALWTPRGRKFIASESDYIEVASIPQSSIITVESWVKPTSICLGLDNPTIVQRRGAAHADMWWLRLDSGKPKFLIWQSDSTSKKNDPTAEDALNADAFYHVVGLADGSNVKCFVNISEYGTSGSYDGSIGAGDVTELISKDYYGDAARYWDGHIAVILVYSRALTPQERLHHHIVGKEMFR